MTDHQPDGDDDDALTWHLWEAAHDRVPLPRTLIEIPAEVTEEEQ